VLNVSPHTIVRPARASDAADIAQLTQQLGYELVPSDAAARLSKILSRDDQHMLVAAIDDRPVGWIHLAMCEYLEGEPFVMVSGLVVDSAHRGQGTGRLLMTKAEEWARTRGCAIVRLWSSVGRTDTHRFYSNLGYTIVKTQHAFIKSLDGDGRESLARFAPRIGGWNDGKSEGE